MASIEFLTKRIEGAEAKVEKLTKKMERIKVALAGGKNPYSYGEHTTRYNIGINGWSGWNFLHYEDEDSFNEHYEIA